MNVEEDKRGLQRAARVRAAPRRAQAGIQRGDLIVSVNGRSIAGLNSDVATARIKGPAGTTVRLGVVTPG